MKKVILVVLVALFAQTVFAQNKDTEKTKKVKDKTFKGDGFQDFDIFVTGTLSFQSVDNQDVLKSNTFTLSPKIGYFLTNEFAVGLDLGFKTTTTDETISVNTFEETVDKQFSIGGFGRYYFLPLKKFSLFGQAAVNYLSTNVETTQGIRNPLTGEITYTEAKLKANGFGLGLSAGANYFLNSHFALETFVGFFNYNSIKPDFPGAKNINAFSIGIDLSTINFGVLYRF